MEPWKVACTGSVVPEKVRSNGRVQDLRLPLEDGLEVRFEGDVERAQQYRRGDYWTIPVRVVTGEVEWHKGPNGRPQPKRPQGIDYHYAPLAVVLPHDATEYTIVDLRVPFPHRRQ